MLPPYLFDWQERQPYEDEEEKNETSYHISEEDTRHNITFCLV